MPNATTIDYSEWPHITAAKQKAATVIEQIDAALCATPIASSDVSVVTFGSIARGERTSGSDVDWLILVDGQADPQHEALPRQFRKIMDDLKLVPPGRTGMFGDLEFSHHLIHQIGGEEDTNSNLTRRVSLLLEARAVGNPNALDRTVRGIVDRYVEDMLVLTHLPSARPRVPRFLLNDLVRLWRTMAVDYANKKRARAADGWALRNLKLRMSRKLIFASGLLTCFSCQHELDSKWVPRDPSTAEDNLRLRDLVSSHLIARAQVTPLDVVASATASVGDGSLRDKLLKSYDEFLELLDDSAKREHLARLSLEQASGDNLWQQVNLICSEFETVLIELFYDSEPYRELTRKYGVF